MTTLPGEDELKAALEHYNTALELKASHSKTPPALVALDGELSSTFRRADGIVSKAALAQVLRWKLARGKFRPTLPKLLDSNDPRVVSRCIAEALQTVGKATSTENALGSGAVEKLAELRGIGPATASAFLSFLPPHHLPFFSDEAADFFTTLRPLKYTLAQYKTFVKLMSQSLEALRGSDEGKSIGWDMQNFERALYTVAVLRREGRDNLLPPRSPPKRKAPAPAEPEPPRKRKAR